MGSNELKMNFKILSHFIGISIIIINFELLFIFKKGKSKCFGVNKEGGRRGAPRRERGAPGGRPRGPGGSRGGAVGPLQRARRG